MPNSSSTKKLDMNKIKRWTVSLPNPDGYAIKPFDDTFRTPREIVLATDHDAEIERLKKRIRDLEQERRNLRVAMNELKALGE